MRSDRTVKETFCYCVNIGKFRKNVLHILINYFDKSRNIDGNLFGACNSDAYKTFYHFLNDFKR